MTNFLSLGAILALLVSLPPLGHAADVYTIYKIKEMSCASGKLGTKGVGISTGDLLNPLLVEIFTKHGAITATDTDAVVTAVDNGANGTDVGGYCDNAGKPTVLVIKLAVGSLMDKR